MSSNQGSCLCKSVQYKLEGEPNSFYLCHCTRCRKVSGTAHVANLFFQDTSIEWVSGKEKVKTYALADSHFKNSFCTQCGSQVPTTLSNSKVMVPAGSLDTDVHIKPNAHIFCDSRANWESSIENTPKFSEMP